MEKFFARSNGQSIQQLNGREKFTCSRRKELGDDQFRSRRENMQKIKEVEMLTEFVQ